LKHIDEKKKEQEEEALKRAGIKGQGIRTGYLYFCKQCFREFELEPKEDLKGKCSNCSGTLITRAERMSELQSKVTQLQETKAERAKKRARFLEWKKQRELAREGPKMVVLGANGKAVEEEEKTSSSHTNDQSLGNKYADWDLWEPSSDDESENLPNQPDAPEFAAMKADMDAREAKKKAARIVSDKENQHGNDAVKVKDYLKAIEHYTNAIQNTRSEKSFYTNRALCYLHTYSYREALKDCENALNIFECFEEEHVRYTSDYKNMKLVLKAYLRATSAHISLLEFNEAASKLSKATKLISELYSSKTRQTPEYLKSQKAELAEVEKLRKELKEKEGFKKEEEKLVKVAPSAAATIHASADVSATPVAADNSTPAASPADTAAVQALVSSLQTAHAAVLASSSSAPVSDVPKNSSWSLLHPCLAFLALTLDSAEGNKERVCSHPQSRVCIDAVVRILKASDPTTSATNNKPPQIGAPTALPSTFPNFASLTSALAPHSPTHAQLAVTWRESNGFPALGSFLNACVGVLQSGPPQEETIRFSIRILLLIAG
jgi:DNA-directed RNA polymerase subunit RPC12/RpoP